MVKSVTVFRGPEALGFPLLSVPLDTRAVVATTFRVAPNDKDIFSQRLRQEPHASISSRVRALLRLCEAHSDHVILGPLT